MPATLTLTAPGQSPQRLTVPTSWADVSLATFVALHAPMPGDERTAAELLLGLPAGGLGQLAAQDVPYLFNLLEFAADPAPVLELLPTPGLPDPGSLPWGCLLLVQQHLSALAGRPDLSALPYILAVYRCQLARSNTDRVAEVEAALLAAPVTESYADGAFFLAGARRSLSGTSQKTATRPSPKMPSLTPTPTRRWLSALGLPWHWTRSPAVT